MVASPPVYRPCCEFCGDPLTPGGYALACMAGGKGGWMKLPDYCASAVCLRARYGPDIARAIARGVITGD